jgi:ATP diphosphatase
MLSCASLTILDAAMVSGPTDTICDMIGRRRHVVRAGPQRFPPSPEPFPMKPSSDIARLIEIMAALRTPGSGCPWDLEQNFQTIAPYTIEEAYEVADAIAHGDLAELKDELGDLLLQVVYHARMAEEQGAFEFGDVVEAITAKMIRRHPHVFPDDAGRLAEVKSGFWERIKAEERAKAGAPKPAGALAGVPVGLPALTRALKLQEKAGRVGFDWNDPRAVLAKIREEADEIEAELDAAESVKAGAEVGDLLFAVVNLARHLKADPEGILRATNLKFERRFAAIEAALAACGKKPQDATLAEMDALWDEAKAAEKKEAAE